MAVQELGFSPMLLKELAALVGTKHEDVEVLDFVPLCTLSTARKPETAKEHTSLCWLRQYICSSSYDVYIIQ
jgi:hypothetical protein